ncbi:MAG: sulfatase-like hydrolase/transferase [Candidatus Hydrogenedentes bacterium]|nr:sulfatase-like hydrolase/transferase [Candidatus Hydrogenedentota bacterium]
MLRSRRDFLREIGIATGCTLGATAFYSQASPDTRPNIVIVMADDQGWGDMAYNGHPLLKTPHFDAFAREGIRFDRFYAAAPVCSPTRGSVMTGRHPNRFGCFSWGYTLRPQEVTLAEALKSAGYVTGHFGKWHLGSVREGSPVNPGASGFDHWLSAPNFFDNDPILSREGKAVQTQGESSMVTVDAAIDFIHEQTKGDQPFFAVVWFGSPHNPHKAAPEYRAMYGDAPDKQRDFLGEITGMDAAFGKLRHELQVLGIRDNTLLWYCSDNGGLPDLGRTGGRGHKGDIYEGGLRVPAILEWPAALTAPAVIDAPCVTSDLYPTLLDIVDAHPDQQPPLDGMSLLPLLKQEAAVRSKPIGFWEYPAKGVRTPSDEWMKELLEAQAQGEEPQDKSRLRLDAGEITRQYPLDRFPGHAAWLDWPWKLHRIEDEEGAVKLELYQLQADGMEAKDLAYTETDRVAAMQAEMENWLRSVVRSLNGEDYA